MGHLACIQLSLINFPPFTSQLGGPRQDWAPKGLFKPNEVRFGPCWSAWALNKGPQIKVVSSLSLLMYPNEFDPYYKPSIWSKAFKGPRRPIKGQMSHFEAMGAPNEGPLGSK